MKIPDELFQLIAIFIHRNYMGTGLLASPSEVGIACQQIAAEWLVQQDGRESSRGLDCDGLVAWAGRLGKHVGSFYIFEKEA